MCAPNCLPATDARSERMKSDISFARVKTLFKLDLKSRFGSTHKQGIKYRLSQAMDIVFFLAVYAVVILGMYYLTNMFAVQSKMTLELLVIISMATMIVATVIAIGTIMKNLYQNGDNEMLLRFPVSGKEILLAKSIYCFLHNLVVCTMFMLPFYVIFGVATNAPVGDYFAYIGVVLLSSIVTFAVANILAVPAMKLINFFKNKFVVVLIVTIIIVCGIFTAYLLSLSQILEYLKDTRTNIFSPEMILRYKAFATHAYPFKWYAELLSGRRLGTLNAGGLALRFLYIALMTVALSVAGYFITSRAYYKTILYGVENGKATVTRKAGYKRMSTVRTLLTKEFFLILRSFNYSFEYLAMACTAPLMVFFCNRLAATMGMDTVGAAIMPGITIMVIIIFITVTVSFASTCISREGGCFYMTKVMPVSFRTQVLTKFLLYSVVATLSVALSCLVTGIYYTSEAGQHALSAVDIAAIWGISEILVISLTSLSMAVDIKWPTFNVSGDGELVATNKNVALALVIGFFVAIAYGAVVMVANFFPLKIGGWLVSAQNNLGNIYLFLTLVSLLLLAGGLSALLVNLEKRYAKIIW